MQVRLVARADSLLKLVVLDSGTARDHQRLFQVGGGAVDQLDPTLGSEVVNVSGSLVDLFHKVLRTTRATQSSRR